MSFDEKKATLLSAMQAEVGSYRERAAKCMVRQIFSCRHLSSLSRSWKPWASPKASSHRLGAWQSFDLRFAPWVLFPLCSHRAGCKRSCGELGRRG